MSSSPPAWPMSKSNLTKLSNKKYRQRWGLYLLEGYAAIEDAIQQGGQVHGLLIDETSKFQPATQDLVAVSKEKGIEFLPVEPALLNKVSGLVTPPPAVAIMVERPSTEPDVNERGGVILALDRIQDPGNAGTLIRTAAFYGVNQVWMGRGTVERYNPKVLRSAMSADLHVAISADVDLEQQFAEVRKAGGRIYAAMMDGEEDISRRPESGPSVLLLGNEPGGVAPNLVQPDDVRLAISRRGLVDSLNVAMAGAILLDRLVRS